MKFNFIKTFLLQEAFIKILVLAFSEVPEGQCNISHSVVIVFTIVPSHNWWRLLEAEMSCKN